MNTTELASVIRHVISAVGGGLIGSGIIDKDGLDAIAGALAVLCAAAWGIWQKRKPKQT